MSLFEWNKEKHQINLEKHGVDFIDAAVIFEDPDRLERSCVKGDEERFQTIGLLNEVVIFLVYTRRQEKYRIISARKASKKERLFYEQNKKKQSREN